MQWTSLTSRIKWGFFGIVGKKDMLTASGLAICRLSWPDLLRRGQAAHRRHPCGTLVNASNVLFPVYLHSLIKLLPHLRIKHGSLAISCQLQLLLSMQVPFVTGQSISAHQLMVFIINVVYSQQIPS